MALYIYHFFQIVQALRLLFLPKFLDPTLIPCPTSIPESKLLDLMWDMHAE